MKLKNLNTHIEHMVEGYKQLSGYCRQLLELTQKLSSAPSVELQQGLEQTLQQRDEIINRITEIGNDISLHREAVMAALHLKEFSLEKVSDFIYPQLREELKKQRKLIEDITMQIADTDLNCGEAILNIIKSQLFPELRF